MVQNGLENIKQNVKVWLGYQTKTKLLSFRRFLTFRRIDIAFYFYFFFFLCLVGRKMTPWQEKKEDYTQNAELSSSEEANNLFQWCPLLKRQ